MKKLSYLIIALTFLIATEGASAQQSNNMFIKKTVTGDFNQVVEKVTSEFKTVGFGVITDIDMDQKLEEKLDVDLKPYKILGICNPGFAYKALEAEPNIGVFLPCKVIIKQLEGNQVEVVSSNPSMLMKMLHNEELDNMAKEVTTDIKSVIEKL